MKEMSIVQERPAPGNLFQFTAGFKRERCYAELFHFFSNHPYAQFNHLALVHALDIDSQLLIDKSLDELVGKGFVNKYFENGLSLYSLNAIPPSQK